MYKVAIIFRQVFSANKHLIVSTTTLQDADKLCRELSHFFTDKLQNIADTVSRRVCPMHRRFTVNNCTDMAVRPSDGESLSHCRCVPKTSRLAGS